MSLESWKQKYYPIPAKKTGKWNLEDTLRHSIRKWKGFRPANLEEHGLQARATGIVDTRDGWGCEMMTTDQCSLCVKFATNKDCLHCPIVVVTGVRCDAAPSGYDDSPWELMVYDKDPEPMIALLKRVKKEMG